MSYSTKSCRSTVFFNQPLYFRILSRVLPYPDTGNTQDGNNKVGPL